MLKLKNIKKSYNQFTLDCSLEVKRGCITGLIGQNGAGKSTIFKSILGLIKVDNGEVEIFGKTEQDANDKQKLGVVLADSGFSGYLTITDIIPILDNLYIKFEKEDFIEKCKKMNLPTNKQIKDFSTGMKAKLKLLVALTHHAELLILDEPTSGLDVLARDEILDMLREYMEENENRAILISSHISSDLEGLCDDFYMIHDGRIVIHEDTDVLLSDYALLKISDEQFDLLDKQYILKVKKEPFGYHCLTNQKQYYRENYQDIVIENGNIDEFILMMVRGVQV